MDEPQKAASRPREVDALVHELGDLVESLGLEEDRPAPGPARRARRQRPASRPGGTAAVATPEARPSRPVRTAPRPLPAPEAPAPKVRAEPEPEVVAETVAEPEVAAEPVAEPQAPAAGVLEDTTYWVPPAEMIEPGGRPWSPAAAMELLPGSREAAEAAEAMRPQSGWLMTAAAGAAVAFALFALVVSHVDLGSTGGPQKAISAPPFTLTVLRTVAADTSGAVAAAQTTTSFPTSTTHLFVDIQYTGATPHDSLELKVIHDSDGLPPPTVVQDHTYGLNTPSGEGTMTVELTAPSGTTFQQGQYTVSVTHGESSAQTFDFTIGQS